MKAIIPCCGFGKRMGMKNDQSKEMLPDPENKSAPIIEYCLNLCKQFDIEPLIITRKEKTDLIEYINKHQIKYIIYEPKENEEWNNSVLASKNYWTKENLLLILPDTRFDSWKCIEDIQRGLELGNNAVMALHEVKDPENWGMVEDYVLFEKPPTPLAYIGKQWAWGLIGIKDTYGQELFSNVRYMELKNVGFTYLKSFEDLTRGDK